MASEVTPIWKDLKYTYTGTPAPAYLDYILRRDSAAGEIIYTGRAYKRPGDANVSFSVNSIVANLLSNPFPLSLIPAARPSPSSLSSSVDVPAGVSIWIAVRPPEGAYSAFSELGFFQNDWAYYGGVYYAGRNLAEDTWGERSITFLRTLKPNESELTYDGRIIDCRMPNIYTGLSKFSPQRAYNAVSWAAPGATVSGFITQPDGERAPYRQSTDVQTCYRYVLYFLSAFGGWSFLYLEAVKEFQDYARQTAKRLYDASDLKARGDVNYVNQVTKRWTAKTPYFTDDQAAKMWHVAGTTAAYLFDMETATWNPVNVTNAQWDGKTYRNEGGKRVRYDINLTLAQDRLRR